MIDWQTKPWWLRPLVALTIGVSSGLIIGRVIAHMPDSWQPWAYASLLGIFAVFVIWQLLDLSRQNHRYQADIAKRMVEIDEILARVKPPGSN